MAMGDTLTFDVQGVPLETRIVAIREVGLALQPTFLWSFRPRRCGKRLRRTSSPHA